jgi:hypothetical protein
MKPTFVDQSHSSKWRKKMFKQIEKRYIVSDYRLPVWVRKQVRVRDYSEEVAKLTQGSQESNGQK